MIFKFTYVFFFIWIATFFIPSKVIAQQTPVITFHFDQDTIHVTSGKTFTNKIIVKNATNETIHLLPISNNTLALNGLIKLPDTLHLAPNETRSFPLKYMADRNTINKTLQLFTIGFISIDKQISIQQSASFCTKITQNQSLFLVTDQSEYYLDQTNQQVQFMIRAINNGLIPLTFKINLSDIPNGIDFTGESLPITLQAGAQMQFPFTVKNKIRNSSLDFMVNIKAIDELGESIASNRIRFMSIGSVKNFGSQNSFSNDIYNNSIALRYMSMNKNMFVNQLQGNGELAVGQNKNLIYRINLDYYSNENHTQVYDSHLDYQDKKWGIKLGNIYENLDHNLSGRGVKANYTMSESSTINLYALENNYLLFGRTNEYIGGAKILAADYRFKTKNNKTGNVSYIHNQHDYKNIISNQINGKSLLFLNENQSLEYEGGYSLENGLHGAQRHAIAGGMNYNYRGDRYQFYTNNYYSSPFYKGIRRGLIQSDSRISKTFENKQMVFARISFLDNNPKYQEQEIEYQYQNHNQVQIYEIGFNQLLGSFNINIKPYMMIQNLDNQYFYDQEGGQNKWKSNALRTVVDLSFYSKANRFSLNTDYGYIYKNTTNIPTTPFHSLRINGSYANGNIGFNTYIQLNPYYLNDLYSLEDNQHYQVYSFGPNTQFNIFNKKLEVQLSTQYNFYSLSNTQNISGNGKLSWKMKGNWEFTTDFYLSRLRQSIKYEYQSAYKTDISLYNNKQIRLGIVKKFGAFTPTKGYKLQLSYFVDHNKNGIKEADEPFIKGILVKIDKDATITDANGTVVFHNMLEGTYATIIENNQGWVAQGETTIILKKNKSVQIPLIKTKILKGKIIISTQKYQEGKPNLSGIRINALDKLGNRYRTHTDDQGNYTFYLASGSYNIFVETDGMAFSIENSNNDIFINEDGNDMQLDFIYKDKRRKVEIKKF